MKKPYLAFLMFYLLLLSNINAQDRNYANKDSVFIKKVILKWQPLALIEFKNNIAFSVEFSLGNAKTINIQLGIPFNDQRQLDCKQKNLFLEHKIRINSGLPNFILKTDFRSIQKAWKKKENLHIRYNALRIDYHLTNYKIEYKICNEWQLTPGMGFFNSYTCINPERLTYSSTSHEIGFSYLWGKEIIYSTGFVLDIFTGPGIKTIYSSANNIKMGEPDRSDLKLTGLCDILENPYGIIKNNDILLLPTWSAGIRLGFSL